MNSSGLAAAGSETHSAIGAADGQGSRVPYGGDKGRK